MSYAGDLTTQEAWSLLTESPDAILVDVRTPGEWKQIGVPDTSATGREAGFVPWVNDQGQPNPSFISDLAALGLEPADGRPVVFLCRSGQRSIGAANAATAAGFGPAYNVLDGFEGPVGPDGQRNVSGWKVANLPWKSL
ncbi:rhodanese-related sulfurtransferase [Rarobacter incanus]|uniref:Rhodanese-related sulfurtransferase n=2 Tax=Rarobacter incanus TaxID=153494 RepID=A0A542SQG2_9MICO|nr:rhodanese-related sulfurtransferase [Rarobacter incanus]